MDLLPVAVVRSRPNCKDCLVEVPFVSFHYQLVCSAYQVYIVSSIKLESKENKQVKQKSREKES